MLLYDYEVVEVQSSRQRDEDFLVLAKADLQRERSSYEEVPRQLQQMLQDRMELEFQYGKEQQEKEPERERRREREKASEQQ